MSESNRPENKLVAERRKKLSALRADGFAFPNTFRRTALAGQLHRVYDEHSNEAFAEPAQDAGTHTYHEKNPQPLLSLC